MKKVLVIGDSHVFKLIEAFGKSIHKKDWQFKFVVGIGPIIRMLHFDNGKLKLDTNAGNWPVNKFVKHEQFELWYQDAQTRIENLEENELNVNHYDSIVVYGGRIVDNLWYQYQNHYSMAINTEIMLDKLSATQHLRLVNEIRAGNDNVNILSMPNPILNETAFGFEGDSNTNLFGITDMPADASLNKVINIYKRALKVIGSNFIPLPQKLLNDELNATVDVYANPNGVDFEHLNLLGANEVLEGLIKNLSLIE